VSILTLIHVAISLMGLGSDAALIYGCVGPETLSLTVALGFRGANVLKTISSKSVDHCQITPALLSPPRHKRAS
jgi:hypothetical protein